MFWKKHLIFIFKFDCNYDNWITYDNPNYDIVLVDAQSKNRWENIALLYDKYRFKTYFYKTISFIDSDIKISQQKISDYFNIFLKYNLNFASPSYNDHEFFSHKKCFLRYVNCLPRKFLTFNKYSLKKARNYFLINKSGSGIEWVLPKIFDYKGVSIIDEINVDNKYKEKKQKVVIKDLVSIHNKFNLESLYNIEFSRIEHDEEKCWHCYLDLSTIEKAKFSRPSRRSNNCCKAGSSLSNRLMNSTAENMR